MYRATEYMATSLRRTLVQHDARAAIENRKFGMYLRFTFRPPRVDALYSVAQECDATMLPPVQMPGS